MYTNANWCSCQRRKARVQVVDVATGDDSGGGSSSSSCPAPSSSHFKRCSPAASAAVDESSCGRSKRHRASVADANAGDAAALDEQACGSSHGSSSELIAERSKVLALELRLQKVLQMSQERVKWVALGQEVLGLAPRLWIEVLDRKHRYASLLYEYWRRWEVSDTEDSFFGWLENGQGSFIDLPQAPRRLLEEWQVLYLSRKEQDLFRVRLEPGTGRFAWEMDGSPVTSPATLSRVELDDGQARSLTELPSCLPVARSDREVAVAELLAPPLGLSCYRDRLLQDARSSAEALRAAGEEASDDTLAKLASPLIAEGLLCQLRDPYFKDRQDAATQRDGHAFLRGMRSMPASLLPGLVWEDVLKAIDHEEGLQMKTPLPQGASRAEGKGIFVWDGLGSLYVGTKLRGVLHHSSFVRGHCVKVAGGICVVDGWLRQLSPHSGHYQPAEEHVTSMIQSWKEQGVDFSRVDVKPFVKRK